MKIAIFGKAIQENFIPYFELMLKGLVEKKVLLTCYRPFYDFLKETGDFSSYFSATFNGTLLKDEVDILISIGGDGTFLNSVVCVKDSGIPILGVNSGRLGFLANVAQEEIADAMLKLCSREFDVEQRALVQLTVNGEPFSDFNYALNEISVLKTERSSLLKIHAYIGEEYLTTYWSDGLIVATPTGSTAYSLSGGGPIVSPACDNLILTPISPHNLSIRPLIIPGDVQVKLQVESRSTDFILSLDSCIYKMSDRCELFISSADFKLNVVKMRNHNYYETLRNKLRWGEDLRNKK